MILMVATFPLSVLILSPAIVEIFVWFERFVHRQAFEEWEGKYYSYGCHQHIRMYFDDNDAPWFVAEDVLAVLDKKPGEWLDHQFTPTESRTIPGRSERGFSKDGVMKLLSLSSHPETRKFRLWFERYVVMPMERRKEMGIGK